MKRKSRNFKTPKNTDNWQKELLKHIGMRVDITMKLGNDKAIYKNVKIVNVDIKAGNRFMILTEEGKELTLIGGNYLIEKLPEERQIS